MSNQFQNENITLKLHDLIITLHNLYIKTFRHFDHCQVVIVEYIRKVNSKSSKI